MNMDPISEEIFEAMEIASRAASCRKHYGDTRFKLHLKRAVDKLESAIAQIDAGIVPAIAPADDHGGMPRDEEVKS